jgi:hypothetical protein
MLPIQELIEQSELIIGCTGNNVLAGHDELVQKLLAGKLGSKAFVSCSSLDVEFLSLLQQGAAGRGWQKLAPKDQSEAARDLLYYTDCNQCNIMVFKGGYPMNFNGTGISVEPCYIQATRALLLAAFVQTVAIIKAQQADSAQSCNTGRIMALEAQVQQDIGKDFLKAIDPECSLFSREVHNNFGDIDWVRYNSKRKLYRLVTELLKMPDETLDDDHCSAYIK